MNADPQLVAVLFRLLATAQHGRIGHADIEATTPDGITAVTLAALPTAVWQHLRPYVEAFGEIKDIGRSKP